MITLLVIDMQHAWLRGGTPRHDLDGVIARINHAARTVREGGGQVIYIRHSNEEATAGSAGWQVDAAMDVAPVDHLIDKDACDSFAGTELLALLKASGASLLYIGGLATEFCVDTTIRSALSHGFDVVALADAHTTGDRPHLDSAAIVEHHNWVWTHLAAPSGRKLSVQMVADLMP